MPGIVGVITKTGRECAERAVRRMIESVRHESFYQCGMLVEESLGVYVGWVVQENSFAAAMPLRNESSDVTLVFSGQDFSSADAKTALKQRGHDLEPEGPSYLVHLYEEEQSF